jgi:hypothetical protein
VVNGVGNWRVALIGAKSNPRVSRKENLRFRFAVRFNSEYGWSMTVEAIKDAIARLSEEERKQVSDWFDELEEEA